MNREAVETYIKDKYNALPEHLWNTYPNYEAFRHGDNRKWFALIINASWTNDEDDNIDELGKEVDILNVKCPTDMVSTLVNQKGYCRAHYMNRNHWIGIILDGTVSDSEICNLIDNSFDLIS